MAGLIVGAIIGFLVGLFLMMAVWGYGDSYNCKREYFWKCLAVFILILVLICGAFIGCLAEYETTCKYVGEYTAVKTTIETSLNSDSLTGFERVELVNKAAEYNGELASKKVACSKWYGFMYTDELLNLDYINLVGDTNE